MSRVGSIFGNMYVLNQDDLQIEGIEIDSEEQRATSMKLNQCPNPITPKRGFIVGREYAHLVMPDLGEEEFDSLCL